MPFDKLSLLTPVDCADDGAFLAFAASLHSSELSAAAADFYRFQFNTQKKVEEEAEAMFKVLKGSICSISPAVFSTGLNVAIVSRI